jgi:hypothetical protein
MRALLLLAFVGCSDDVDIPTAHTRVKCDDISGMCEQACVDAPDEDRSQPCKISADDPRIPNANCAGTFDYEGQRGCCSPEFFGDPPLPVTDTTPVFHECTQP